MRTIPDSPEATIKPSSKVGSIKLVLGLSGIIAAGAGALFVKQAAKEDTARNVAFASVAPETSAKDVQIEQSALEGEKTVTTKTVPTPDTLEAGVDLHGKRIHLRMDPSKSDSSTFAFELSEDGASMLIGADPQKMQTYKMKVVANVPFFGKQEKVLRWTELVWDGSAFKIVGESDGNKAKEPATKGEEALAGMCFAVDKQGTFPLPIDLPDHLKLAGVTADAWLYREGVEIPKTK